MRREEFLRELERLLSDVSKEEREEAMAFYHSYFEDAGVENEARILEELGSPEAVAETIKRDLGMVTTTGNNTQENGTYGSNYAEGTGYTYTGNQSQNSAYTMYNEGDSKKSDEGHTRKIVLFILLAIFTFPLWIGVVAGLFGTVFGLSVALAAFTFAMFAVGVALIGVGIPMALGISAMAGVAFVGGGFIVLAFALVMLNTCVWIFGKVFPWIIKGIGQLFRKLFGKKEA